MAAGTPASFRIASNCSISGLAVMLGSARNSCPMSSSLQHWISCRPHSASDKPASFLCSFHRTWGEFRESSNLPWVRFGLINFPLLFGPLPYLQPVSTVCVLMCALNRALATSLSESTTCSSQSANKQSRVSIVPVLITTTRYSKHRGTIVISNRYFFSGYFSGRTIYQMFSLGFRASTSDPSLLAFIYMRLGHEE